MSQYSKNFALKLQPHENFKSRINEFLLIYRVTPHSSTDQSPAMLMMGRNPRTNLDQIHPSSDLLERKQQAMIDHGPHILREFAETDTIWYLSLPLEVHRPRYLAGLVVKRTAPQTYYIQGDNGDRVYRHSDQLKPRCVLPGGSADLESESGEEDSNGFGGIVSEFLSEVSGSPGSADRAERALLDPETQSSSDCLPPTQSDRAPVASRAVASSATINNRGAYRGANRGAIQGPIQSEVSRRCFNCGAGDHMSPNCPQQRMRAPPQWYGRPPQPPQGYNNIQGRADIRPTIQYVHGTRVTTPPAEET